MRQETFPDAPPSRSKMKPNPIKAYQISIMGSAPSHAGSRWHRARSENKEETEIKRIKKSPPRSLLHRTFTTQVEATRLLRNNLYFVIGVGKILAETSPLGR